MAEAGRAGAPSPGPLLQISDPHFGTERPQVVRDLLALARALRPEVVVMSGDITQRATRAQFAAARAFVDQLPPSALVVIPGNHDIPLFNLALRALAPYRRFAAALGRELQPAYRSAAWCVLGVKTTRRWRHKHGQVGPAQADAVARELAAAGRSPLKVVVVHQPLAVVEPEDQVHRLRGAAHAAAAWAGAGADLVIGGHIHRPYVTHLDTPAGRLHVAQAGTAVSHRTRRDAGNSVNVLWPLAGDGPRRCTLERWDHDAEHGGFRVAERRGLDLERPG